MQKLIINPSQYFVVKRWCTRSHQLFVWELMEVAIGFMIFWYFYHFTNTDNESILLQVFVDLEDGVPKYVKSITIGPDARIMWPSNCEL